MSETQTYTKRFQIYRTRTHVSLVLKCLFTNFIKITMNVKFDIFIVSLHIYISIIAEIEHNLISTEYLATLTFFEESPWIIILSYGRLRSTRYCEYVFFSSPWTLRRWCTCSYSLYCQMSKLRWKIPYNLTLNQS